MVLKDSPVAKHYNKRFFTKPDMELIDGFPGGTFS